MIHVVDAGEADSSRRPSNRPWQHKAHHQGSFSGLGVYADARTRDAAAGRYQDLELRRRQAW